MRGSRLGGQWLYCLPLLQIVIFRIVFFYLNEQDPEKNEKFEIFASFNKKSDFWGKKKLFQLPAKHV